MLIIAVLLFYIYLAICFYFFSYIKRLKLFSEKENSTQFEKIIDCCFLAWMTFTAIIVPTFVVELMLQIQSKISHLIAGALS